MLSVGNWLRQDHECLSCHTIKLPQGWQWRQEADLYRYLMWLSLCGYATPEPARSTQTLSFLFHRQSRPRAFQASAWQGLAGMQDNRHKVRQIEEEVRKAAYHQQQCLPLIHLPMNRGRMPRDS